MWKRSPHGIGQIGVGIRVTCKNLTKHYIKRSVFRKSKNGCAVNIRGCEVSGIGIIWIRSVSIFQKIGNAVTIPVRIVGIFRTVPIEILHHIGNGNKKVLFIACTHLIRCLNPNGMVLIPLIIKPACCD